MYTQSDIGKLILRLALGLMMLFHGYAKITHGVGFIESKFMAMGIPAFFAYTVYIGEILAPLMLIAGYKTKIAAFLMTMTMVVVIVTAHSEQIFLLNKFGVLQLESVYFFLFASLSLVFLGAGKISVDKG